MTDTSKEAAERIWAQDAQPDECHYTGGGWWDDQCGNTQYSHMVEYVRVDLLDAQADRIDALQAKLDEAVGALEAARDWIDAIPKDTALPAMPGFDRDDFDDTLAKINEKQGLALDAMADLWQAEEAYAAQVALQAKLDEAVGALEELVTECDRAFDGVDATGSTEFYVAAYFARATLAKIKAEKE